MEPPLAPESSASRPVRVCAVVPTYDNPLTVRGVVESLRAAGLPVLVVDDASASAGQDACQRLAADGLAQLVRLDVNAGKGEACRRGFQRAHELGYTHAFQIDADGQHDLGAVSTFVAAAEAQPDALILAYPIYDDSAPASRRLARKVTAFWIGLEVGGFRRIRDALIGFRIYPLRATLALGQLGDRMRFDPESAVRLLRSGVTPVNLPVRVRYLDAGDGGVSHFKPLRDNLGYARMHTRLCVEGCIHALTGRLGRASK